MFRGLFLCSIVVMFNYYWCTRKPLSSFINFIKNKHHTHNGMSFYSNNQQYSQVLLSMGTKLAARLLFWLNTNRKVDQSFKLGNQTLFDAGFHRLYAFWPQLSIQLQCTVPGDGSQGAIPKKIRDNLASQNRHHNQNQNQETPQKGNSQGVEEGGEAPRATCVCAFNWQDRHSVEVLFRDPATFQCNGNVI